MKNLKFQILTCAAVISLEVQASRMLRLGEDSDDFGAELNAIEYIGDSGGTYSYLSLSTMNGLLSSGNVNKELKLLSAHKFSSTTYNLVSQLQLKPASRSARKEYGRGCSLTITNQTIGKSPSFSTGQNPFYFLQGPAKSFLKTRMVFGLKDTSIRVHFVWKSKQETARDEILSVLEIPFRGKISKHQSRTISFQELFTDLGVQIYSNPLAIRRWLGSFDSHIPAEDKIGNIGVFGLPLRAYEKGVVLDRSTHTATLPTLRTKDYWCDILPTSLTAITLPTVTATSSSGVQLQLRSSTSQALTPVSSLPHLSAARLDSSTLMDYSASSGALIPVAKTLISPSELTDEQEFLFHLNQIDLTRKDQVELTLKYLNEFIVQAYSVGILPPPPPLSLSQLPPPPPLSLSQLPPPPAVIRYSRLEDLKVWRKFLSAIEFQDDGMININFTEIKSQKLRHLFIYQLRKASFANKLFGLKLDSTNINVRECIILINKLSKLDNFRELLLSSNKIGAAGAQALAPHLGKLTQLQSLDLGDNEIGAAGTQALAPHLGKLTQLQSLNLGRNEIGAAGAQALAPHLGKLTQLQSLNLGVNSIGTAGAQALAPHLGKLTQLQSLDLGRNEIGAAEAKALAPHLGKLTQLQSLNLRRNEIGDAGAQALAPHLGKLTQLQSLSLENNEIGAAGAKALAPHLGKLTQLQSLSLENNEIGAAGAKALAPHLGKLTQLQSLSLENNEIGAAGAKALAPQLGKLTQLQSLNLESNNIGAVGIKALAPYLVKLTQLQSLNLGGNSIEVAGTQALAPHLVKLTQLQSLNLSGNNIGAAGAQALAPHLGKLTQLQSLDLERNRIGAAGAQALAPHLGKLTQLQSLNLGRNEIGAAGAQALAPHLGKLTQLQSLNLGRNEIGAAGAQALAPHLGKLTQLQSLNLGVNSIGTAGAQALAPHLGKLTQLQSLDLGRNEIGAAEAKALAPHLGKLTQLQSLNLRRNEIGDAGAQALAPHLGKLTQLQSLNLRDNFIGDAGAQALAPYLGKLTQLQSLDLGRNEIGDAGAQALAPHLGKLTQLQSLNLRDNFIGDAGIAFILCKDFVEYEKYKFKRKTLTKQIFQTILPPEVTPEHEVYSFLRSGNISEVISFIQNTAAADLLTHRNVIGSPLAHVIIGKNSLRLLQELINKCPSLLSIEDAQGNTPLHVSAMLGREKITQFLVTRIIDGALVRCRRIIDELTPLHLALRKDKYKSLSMLLDLDEKLNPKLSSFLLLKDSKGVTFLDEIIEKSRTVRHPVLCRILSASKIFYTIETNHITYVKATISQNPNSDLLSQRDSDGNTMLHAVLISKNNYLLKYILRVKDLRVLVNIENNKRDYPLHIAIASGNTEAVQLLLSAGADATHKNGKRQDLYALSLVSTVSPELKTLMFFHGISCNNTDHTTKYITSDKQWKTKQVAGYYPHEYAVLTNPVILPLLIDKGADVTQGALIANYLKTFGKDLESKATQHTFLVSIIAQMKLRHLTRKDKSGTTALHYAIFYNRDDVVRLLLENPKVVNDFVDNSGNTVLHVIAEYGLVDMLDILREIAGGDLKLFANDEGKTPLDIVQGKSQLHLEDQDLSDMEGVFKRIPLAIHTAAKRIERRVVDEADSIRESLGELTDLIRDIRGDMREIQTAVTYIERGVDRHIEIVTANYGPIVRDFYLLLRDKLIGICRWLHIHATGNLETPLGEKGAHIDQIESLAKGIVTASTGVATLATTAALPPAAPFVGAAGTALTAGIGIAAKVGRKRTLQQVQQKYHALLKLIKKIEVTEKCSIEYFCKMLAYKIVDSCHSDIVFMDASQKEQIVDNLIQKMMELAVGGDEMGDFGIVAQLESMPLIEDLATPGGESVVLTMAAEGVVLVPLLVEHGPEAFSKVTQVVGQVIDGASSLAAT